MFQTEANVASPHRIVVVDRQEAMRNAIRAAAEGAGFAVVAECRDGASATAAVVRERAEICLIDADLPGAGEAIAAIGSLPLAPKVIVLASSVDEQAFFAALELGAAGYLLKDVTPARLADDLKSVAEGGMALAPALAARLVADFRRRTRSRAPQDSRTIRLVGRSMCRGRVPWPSIRLISKCPARSPTSKRG